MGIDIEPGCPGEASVKCFSIAVVDDDNLVAKYENIPLHKLIRLIWEYQPDVIAVDNVYELAEDDKELLNLLALLPDNITITQVTLQPDGSTKSVALLAKEAGLLMHQGKLTPAKTAYLNALLALRGYGTKLKFLEDKTKIIVSKARSFGPGGMSQNRYKRRVRAAILHAVKDIRKILDKENIDYDLIFRKSGGGLDAAVFIVYAPRKRLEGLIKQYEDSDVRIEVRPVFSRIITWEAIRQNNSLSQKPYIIVGVDPGTVTGVAVIDLDGRLLYLGSHRGLDRQMLIELVRNIGVPILVATDVKPAPDFVRKLAASLKVQLYEPPESLPVEEKREIVLNKLKELRGNIRIDSHSRDALAAALKAYQAFSQKLSQIEAQVTRMSSLMLDTARIKADVIRGLSIAEAVEREIKRILDGNPNSMYLIKRVRRERSVDSNDVTRRRENESSIQYLKSKVEELTAENIKLRKRIEELHEELRRIKNEYYILKNEFNKSIERERAITSLKHEVNMLRNELEKTRRSYEECNTYRKKLIEALMNQLRRSTIIVPRLKVLSYETLKEVLKYTNLVAAESLSPSLRKAAEKGILGKLVGILVPAKILEKHTKENGIAEIYGVPLLNMDKYLVEEISEDLIIVKDDVVLDAYEIKLKIDDKRSQELTMERLREIIEEYRKERIQTLMLSAKEES
ncbi:MAG: DUF460 domain-containing protein [Pyrodictiaceae archaeon]